MTTHSAPERSLVATGQEGTADGVTHTDEELRNLATIRALRAASVEGRRQYLAAEAVVHRRGMAHLAEAGGSVDGSGYHASSIADRVDTIEDIVAKGDRVWAVWTIRGTHTGSLFGIEPTGRPIEVLELGIWRLVEGKVAEAWFFADEFGLARALGLSIPGNGGSAADG